MIKKESDKKTNAKKIEFSLKVWHPSKVLYTFLENSPFARDFSQKTVNYFWAYMKDVKSFIAKKNKECQDIFQGEKNITLKAFILFQFFFSGALLMEFCMKNS